MRSFLVFAVWVTIVGAAEESLKQQLLRVLTDIEKRNNVETSPTTPSTPLTTPSNEQSTETVTDAYMPNGEITFAEFDDTVQGWVETSKQFNEEIELIKPMILSTLTRTEEWEVVAEKLNSIFEHSSKVYGQILDDALDLGHRLYSNKEIEGFGESGGCNSIKTLSESFDPLSDPYAEVKVIQAIIFDLDCFGKEFQDIMSSLDDSCMIENEIGVDKALGMLGDVMKFLYRWKSDGEQFEQAARIMEIKVQQMYESMNFSPNLVKRLLSKIVLNQRDRK